MKRVLIASTFATCLAVSAGSSSAADQPNILWITSEDNGPQIGAYGDKFADTPNIDGLAGRSLIYLNAWSTAPVCAPARTTIISGVYPPATGSQHMRSKTQLPEFMKMYPQYLREAGYYCTNNSKEDYNLEKPGQVWDASSRQAHWKNRKPGQPFFAIFNHTVSHESRLRIRPHQAVHDARQVRVPAYHPDTPEVRQDWAQYYDKVTEMDQLVGNNLREIAEAGLADDTIVFYYGDHGSGMPRSKRWPYNSGLNVPFLVHIPEKFKHLRPADYAPGAKTKRLVGFIDLAPTLLSIVGIEPPDYMQGHAFLGQYAAAPQPFAFGFRGRMDERYDMVRTIRDERYIYIRNYMPHKIYGQYIAYMFQTPTTRVWKELYDANKLSPPQTYFWETKPAEELYDLAQDPDEVHNLADRPEHRKTLEKFRKTGSEFALKIRDLGFLPEDEIHRRSAGSTPYEMGHDPARFPLEDILPVANLATSGAGGAIPKLKTSLTARDSAVRYWAAMGFLIRGRDAVAGARPELQKALQDSSWIVRTTAAQALAQYGEPSDLAPALDVLIEGADLRNHGLFVAMWALNALDELDERARPLLKQIQKLPTQAPDYDGRLKAYVPNLINKTLADLGQPAAPKPRKKRNRNNTNKRRKSDSQK